MQFILSENPGHDDNIFIVSLSQTAPNLHAYFREGLSVTNMGMKFLGISFLVR